MDRAGTAATGRGARWRRPSAAQDEADSGAAGERERSSSTAVDRRPTRSSSLISFNSSRDDIVRELRSTVGLVEAKSSSGSKTCYSLTLTHEGFATFGQPECSLFFSPTVAVLENVPAACKSLGPEALRSHLLEQRICTATASPRCEARGGKASATVGVVQHAGGI